MQFLNKFILSGVFLAIFFIIIAFIPLTINTAPEFTIDTSNISKGELKKTRYIRQLWSHNAYSSNPMVEVIQISDKPHIIIPQRDLNTTIGKACFNYCINITQNISIFSKAYLFTSSGNYQAIYNKGTETPIQFKKY